MPVARRLQPQPAVLLTAASVAVLAIAAAAALRPVLHNDFVNWDDPAVLLDNPHLAAPGVLAWAFSTTLMGHYQPLAWLAWSAAKSSFGLSPAVFHALSLGVHVANAVVIYAVTVRLASGSDYQSSQRGAAGLFAGLLFALHPAVVEPVAWASAFPYVLSLFALLLSFLAYISERPKTSLVMYAASSLTRATALGYPLILLVVDRYVLDRRRGGLRARMIDKAPFFAVAAVMAVAEWLSRDVTSLREIGIVARLAMTTTAPFVYLWRTLWPVALSPLYVRPIVPSSEWIPLTLALAGLVTITAFAWRVRRRWPIVGIAWISYLALLAPVAGFTPSGLQATADRYMYVPGVVIAVVAGLAVGRAATARGLGVAAITTATTAVAALGVLTWTQTRYWNSSTTLWTRAAELDVRNDVATYNLAVALAESGRDDDAIAWYERTLALVPDHELAGHHLAILRATQAERRADQLATMGRAGEAIAEYGRALALDPRRSHARAARGMLMMKRGQFREAAAELELAIGAGVEDAEVHNGLAFALLQTGDARRAASVLKRAVASHPDSVNLKHNLARLLATATDPTVRDGSRALELALDVCARTGNADPRALDTLATAYAATGRFEPARATASRAEARARELGDAATAAEIAAHARSYRR
jgi:tetratricopeptide (TPR) repeat protein